MLLRIRRVISLFRRQVTKGGHTIHTTGIPVLRSNFLMNVIHRRYSLLFHVTFFVRFLCDAFTFFGKSSVYLSGVVRSSVPLLGEGRDILFLLRCGLSIRGERRSSYRRNSMWSILVLSRCHRSKPFFFIRGIRVTSRFRQGPYFTSRSLVLTTVTFGGTFGKLDLTPRTVLLIRLSQRAIVFFRNLHRNFVSFNETRLQRSQSILRNFHFSYESKLRGFVRHMNHCPFSRTTIVMIIMILGRLVHPFS